MMHGWRPAAIALSLLAGSACVRTLAPPPPEARRSWERQVLAQMSLEEKVGQMVFARAEGVFLHEADPAFKALEELAQSGRIGGVVFFRGDPYGTAAIANHMQDKARWPLLMASDYEWGPAFRVEGASRFPSAMAVGAGGDERDVQFQAEVTAREARAMGIHLALAPVVDVLSNPASSVINYRSYGEDPERVGRLAAAFIRKAQEEGLLTTAKHFPGHGATAVDSHLRLPVLRLSRERFERVELAPFRAAVAAGVAAVMTAHVAAPALDGRPDRPATFSREILEGLLRGQLGFEGLIVSDALDMGAARERWWEGDAAVRALWAGCDLLLVPPDPIVAWDAVCRAVRRGAIPLERIERSVMRILDAKARLSLHLKRIVDPRDLPRRVGDVRFKRRLQQMADRSVTLVDQRFELLPFHAEAPPRILLVSLVQAGDRRVDPSVLEQELSARSEAVSLLRLSSESVRAGVVELAAAAEDADVTVVASYCRTRSTRGRGDLPVELVVALRGLIAKDQRVILASMGNPYVLTELPGAAALLAAYDFAPLSQRALARALFGEIDVGGRLPVTLSERFPVGHGRDLARRSLELETAAAPEEAGFSRKGLDSVLQVLREGIRSKAFPGGVVVVGRRGKIVLEKALGRQSYEGESPRVTHRTLYDLASLTKVVVTTTLAMILYERGKLLLEKPVREVIPEFQGEGKDGVQVIDLLAHTSGLPAWADLYRSTSGMPSREAKERTIADICRIPLEYAPRSESVYSDLGFLLLGEILERVSGRPLEKLAEKEIFAPLGMDHTMFNPPPALLDRIAPTENDPWRGRLLRGEVHDENAYALGGVAAHAGLFSTAGDLARFAQMLLNGGVYGTRRILRRSTVRRFTARADLAPGSDSALGWDTPSKVSSSGRYFSDRSFGHTGFTGTSIWVDPERELFVVLLTNRVHPSRTNEGIREVRPALHDAVMEAIVDEEIRPRGH